jgi:ferredoxin
MLRGTHHSRRLAVHKFRDALDRCLSCKACSTDCPVGIDMATYKAEFLHHHRGRLRPRSNSLSAGMMPTFAPQRAVRPVLRTTPEHPAAQLFIGSFTRAVCPGVATATARFSTPQASRAHRLFGSPEGFGDFHELGGAGTGPWNRCPYIWRLG